MQNNSTEIQKDILAILKAGYEHLHKNNSVVKMEDLEEEVICFASYIYLKNLSSIDFELEYLDQSIIDSLESFDLETVDVIIDIATLLFRALQYTPEHALNAKKAVRSNVELVENYEGFLKNYFTSKHKISNKKAEYRLLELQLYLLGRYDELIDAKEQISSHDFEFNDICLQTAMYAVREKMTRINMQPKKDFFSIRDYIIDLMDNDNDRSLTLDKSRLYFEKSIKDVSILINNGKVADRIQQAKEYKKNTIDVLNCITELM